MTKIHADELRITIGNKQEETYMTIADLFSQAEPYMRALDHVVYHQPHRAKELLIKQKWQEFAVPKLTEIYSAAAQAVTQIIESPLIRDAEIGYLAALGSGVGASDWAADLTGEIAASVQVEHLGKESVVALASYVTTVRLLGQLAEASSVEDLGCCEHQIDVRLDSDIVEVLALLYHYETDALGRPAETTLAAVEHLVAAGETSFGEAPALILLRWAQATGFLREHAPAIQTRVDDYLAEAKNYASEIDMTFDGLTT